MFSRPDRLAFFVMTLLCVAAAPVRHVEAQEPTPTMTRQPAGPFRDVFARPRREGTQILTFSLSGYGGYDDNVIADETASPGVDPRARAGGSSLVGADAGLQYEKIEHRASFGATLGGAYRYFPSRSSLSQSSFNAGAGVGYQLAHRTHVRLEESFAYLPYYQLGLFPGFGDQDLGAAFSPNLDFAVLKRRTVLTTTDASLDQQLSRRSTLTLTGQFFYQTLEKGRTTAVTTMGETTKEEVAQEGDVRGYTAGLHFKRALSRYMTFRIGDEYRRFVYPSPRRRVLEGNNIDAGIDYSRSLPFSRRTSFSFSTGSSIVSFDGQQFVDVTGTAGLTHQFARNWQGRVSYNRDLSFVQTLSHPLFGDAASAQLQGIIHRRLLMSIAGGYLSGRIGLNRTPEDNARLRTGTGSFTLIYAITDYLRSTFEYSYFNYHFSNDAVLPEGLRPSFDRNSLRGGLSLVLPLIR